MTAAQNLELNHRDLPVTFRGIEVPASQLRMQLRNQTLLRVRSGIYVDSRYIDGFTGFARERVQRLCDISALSWLLKENEAISHQSAAILWGLRLTVTTKETHVTAFRGRPVARFQQKVHQTEIPVEQIVSLSGIQVTSLERTVVDCARTLPNHLGLVVADHALALGARAETCLRINQELTQKSGKAKAESVIHLATPHVDSAPESIVRSVLHSAGIEGLTAQYGVRVGGHRYWLDLAIPLLKIAIEYDGRIKYQENPDALYNEKIRHENLVRAGWIVIRVIAQDLREPHKMINRVRHEVSARISRIQ